ncbi:hypothetical protein JE943_000947 [Flavobacterium psychrophilum]|nr:hypothetical protein [Flavobacterium psychrophilum]
MGYYTRHKLTIIDGEDNINYEQEIADSTTDYSSLFDDSIKWYDCEKDMKEYSKNHPNVVFCINGEGEESGDIWKAYFQNGKMFKTEAKLMF